MQTIILWLVRILAILLIPASIFIGYDIYHGDYRQGQEMKNQNIRVTGIVTNIEIIRRQTSRRRSSEDCRISYEYSVNSVDYSKSKRYDFVSQCEPYNIGMPVWIYYEPTDPDFHYFDEVPSAFRFFSPALAVAFIGLWILFMVEVYEWFRGYLKRRAEKSGVEEALPLPLPPKKKTQRR